LGGRRVPGFDWFLEWALPVVAARWRGLTRYHWIEDGAVGSGRGLSGLYYHHSALVTSVKVGCGRIETSDISPCDCTTPGHKFMGFPDGEIIHDDHVSVQCRIVRRVG
jgi:hypothetical protein